MRDPSWKEKRDILSGRIVDKLRVSFPPQPQTRRYTLRARQRHHSWLVIPNRRPRLTSFHFHLFYSLGSHALPISVSDLGRWNARFREPRKLAMFFWAFLLFSQSCRSAASRWGKRKPIKFHLLPSISRSWRLAAFHGARRAGCSQSRPLPNFRRSIRTPNLRGIDSLPLFSPLPFPSPFFIPGWGGYSGATLKAGRSFLRPILIRKPLFGEWD